jgi:hypothetical protein
MRSSYLLLGGALVVAIAAAAWPRPTPVDPVPAADSARADGTGNGMQGAAAPTGPALSGTVIETIQVPSYTYLRIQTASGEQWAAVQTTQLEKGAQVSVVDAVPMEKFTSKALNRTFDLIYFGSLAGGGAGAGALPPGHPAVAGDPSAMPPGHPTASSSAMAPVGPIEKAQGGMSVAEIFDQKKAIAGKSVRVRGSVTKATAVMGAYYVHIADGTGTPTAANNDLTVVLAGATGPNKGDIILVEGKVELDKDIGAGYQWPVILVDAVVK